MSAGKKVRRWFCHYYDNGQKTWSLEGGFRIAREAALLKNADGSACFDEIRSYRKRDLPSEWVEKRKAHFEYPRGAGLWVWKPEIVRMTLDQMAPGDELLYCDTGCELKGSVEPVFQLLALPGQDCVCFELDIHHEYQWTKGDAFLAMQGQEFKDTKQRLSGIFLFRKCSQAYKIVDAWGKFCDQVQLVSPGPSLSPNYPGFKEHRHDQSGWSLATKKFNVKAFPDITWPLSSATIIAASRRHD